MSTGIFSIGVSGMQVAQLNLLTTEHNITNVNTPGFSRQRAIQASNSAVLTGAGYVGEGTHVTTIERMYNSFLTKQVNSAQTTSSELTTYSTHIKQIDDMLADANSGLSPALQDFFSGMQQVAANPSLLPARQALASSAQALVARYQGIEDRLSQMYEGINTEVTTTVANINSYSEQIAAFNERIIVAQSSIDQPPNDLLDQRDQLVSELNKLVKVTTTSNSDGSYNVFIGNGQQLVVGAQVNTLAATPSAADPSRITVGLKNSAGIQELPESLLTGGSLGGLLSFRSVSLDRAANELGRNAASLALTFNAQHALGQDLLGQSIDSVAPPSTFAADFFTISQPTVIGNTGNSSTLPIGAITATLSIPTSSANYTNLTNADYQLAFDGTNYTLTRSTDSQQWSNATVAGLSTAVSATEGFTFAETSPMAAGDSFKIEPARAAAKNITLNPAIAADVRLIAAAAPIRTGAGTINLVTNVITNSNKGSATISAGSVATGYPAAVVGVPLTLTYNSGAPANLSGFPAGTAVRVTNGNTITDYPAPAGSVTYASGATITLIGSNFPTGLSFEITGTPTNGDTFSIARNTSGVSDGRNALALGQLQAKNTMSGQTATFQSAYAQLVSDNGNKTREIEVKGEAQSALLDQSKSARDSLSGVNLDEEAASLIRYQQAYQASAKMLEIGTKLFDVLLGING